MLAAVYVGAKQALPEDVLGGRVDPPKQVLLSAKGVIALTNPKWR